MNGRTRWLGNRLRTRRLAGLARRKQRGQTVLELAVFLPLLLVFGLACIQFAVIFAAYMNVIQVTRDATRWVAVHPHVIDSTTEASIRSRLPAGVSSGALTLAFSPACTALSSGKCTARTSGAQNLGDVDLQHHVAPLSPELTRMGHFDRGDSDHATGLHDLHAGGA